MPDLKLRVIADDQASRLLDSISGKFKKSGQAGQQFGKKVEAGAKRVDKSLGKVEAQSKKASIGIIGLVQAAGALIIFREVAGFFIEATKSAIAFQEVQAKFETVFRGNVESAEGFATVLVESFNISESAAKAYLSTIQDTLVPMGLARSEAAGLANEVIQLAADLSSFNDVPTADVVRDLQSALVGNTETIKKYGVILRATDIQQRALANSGKDVADELTNAEKVAASFQLILEGTADAQGDVARTSGSSANQLRKLSASYQDLTVLIGQEATPVLRAWAKVAQFAVEASRGMFGANKDNLTVRESAIVLIQKELKQLIQLTKVGDQLVVTSIGSIDVTLKKIEAKKKLLEQLIKEGKAEKKLAEEKAAAAAEEKAITVPDEKTDKRIEAEEKFNKIVRDLQNERLVLQGEEFEARRNQAIEEAGARELELEAIAEQALISQEELDAAKEELLLTTTEKLDEIRKDEVKKDQERIDKRISNEKIASAQMATIAKERLDAGRNALDDLASFSNSKNRELAAVGKAAAIAKATIDTFTGAQAAFTSLAGIPIVGPALGTAAAAAAIAAGLARVAQIKSTSSFLHGTQRVPGQIGEPVSAIVHGGETITPAGSLAGANRAGGGTTIIQNITQNIQVATLDVESREIILTDLAQSFRDGGDGAREFASEAILAAERNEGLST